MWILYILLYIIVGSACTGYLVYRITKHEKYFDVDDNIQEVIWTGLLWPVIAPIVLVSIIANDYAKKKLEVENEE